MGAGKVILNVFLGFLLVLASVLFILLSGFNQVFYPDVYVNAFEENGTYSTLSSMDGQAGGYFNLSPEEMKLFLDGAIVNFTDYLRGDSENLFLKLKLDNSKIRQAIIGNFGTVPPCLVGQSMELDGQIVCRNSSMSVNDFADYLIKFNDILKNTL